VRGHRNLKVRKLGTGKSSKQEEKIVPKQYLRARGAGERRSRNKEILLCFGECISLVCDSRPGGQ